MRIEYGNITKDLVEFTELASIIRSNALKDKREPPSQTILEMPYRLVYTGGGLFCQREKKAFS
ncbi:hypothetical protein HMPREF9081_1763 [Centipeda periodontii DSM 2778]|uniref:Uncharacterized protein n=1 Tax=Centipeda periodontii DSM 2778 TaxID=888060 RepID=F5RNC7_9FIRM|nr:hypothetical protein HMPREF9081_1763 [Centipeda periodontii DSM 2778]